MINEKDKFLLILKGKEYGGKIVNFNPATLCGNVVVADSKIFEKRIIVSTTRWHIPRRIVEYLDDKLLVTDKAYYNIVDDNVDDNG